MQRKPSACYFALLVTALFVDRAQGKEGVSSKPDVYYVGKDFAPEEQSALRKEYGTRFHIVDVADSRSLNRPKWRKKEKAEPHWDASGKLITGQVGVGFILTPEGRVVEPFILRSTNRLLNTLALNLITQWRANPARWNRSPVATLMSYDFHFEPDRPEWVLAFPDAGAINANGTKFLLRDYPNWMGDVIKKVQPEYPHSGSKLDGAGDALLRVIIDLKTGSVTNVTILKSTGFERLDASALKALRYWRWKPAKWKQIDILVTFVAPSGASLNRSGSINLGLPPRAVPSFVPRGVTP